MSDFAISSAGFTLAPTSEAFARALRGVDAQRLLFGNWIDDTAEHETASTPRRGDPRPSRLRVAGLAR